METSEQQRRPTIGQSAQELRRLGLEFDAVDLADMLWLAQYIELEASARATEPTPTSVTPAVRTVDEGSTASNDPVASLFVDDPGDTRTAATTTVDDEGEEPEEPQGTPFPVPAAPAIRTRLDLARSLRPLMRKVPSRLRQELDEEATVTQIAETGLWVPVVKPQAERWLELDLVVEDSKTTFIWERVIAELQHLVEYQGAFRAIRTWRLAVPDLQTATAADIKLFPRWHETPENRAYQRPRSPRELIDPRSRRLVWLITDCTSLLWRRGLIHDTLWAWAETQPVSLVQMFPERLWTRTALRDGHIVRLGATGPGLPSARLEVAGLPVLDDWDDDDLDDDSPDAEPGATANRTAVEVEQRQLVLPVVTLDPQAMQRWARVMAGSGDGLIPGRVFELKTIRQMAQEYQTWSAQTPAKPRTARQRLALFRSGASDTAQQLVEYLAATPVSLPVIDLLRDEFVPQARQEHVAEVLLSGLLQRQDEPEDEGLCRYEFYADPKTDAEAVPPREKVRELLLDSVPVSRSREVLDRLSQLITDRAGNTLKSFEAFLSAYAAAGEALGEGALPLAEVGLSVLQRLGGSHAALARQYATVLSPPVPPRPPRPPVDDPFPLQEVEYEVAEYLNIPPLQTEMIRTPTILAVLNQSFEFETATIESERRLLGLRREWVIRKRRAMAWGYTEVLSQEADAENAVGLDMIALPGGTFTMGAPKGETGSSDDERPPHDVTIQPFYISRYPITQAQWWTVASMGDLELPAAIQLADEAVRSIRGSGLSDVEQAVLAGAWRRETYQRIAAAANYTEGYLSRDVAPNLWDILSQALGTPIRKTNLRTALTRLTQSNRPESEHELNPNPSNFRGDDTLPVEKVSWDDAQEFCRRLSVLTGKDYRLPTEAEWEYACRAGTTTPFHFGEMITADLANYRASSAFGDGPTGEYRKRTTAVGQFTANGFGLYDMHGNVWEWCQDHWHESYEGAPTDGTAWLSSDESKKSRVLRGGSWGSDPEGCRSAVRIGDAPDFTIDFVGFRVVCGLARA